jgi:hypothetical protein
MHVNAEWPYDITIDGGRNGKSDSWWGRKLSFDTKERCCELQSTIRDDDGRGTHKGISMVVSQEDIVCEYEGLFLL